MNVQHYYLWGSLFFVLPMTLCMYIAVPNGTRWRMMISGVGFGIVSVILDKLIFMTTYWRPTLLITGLPVESFLYGFLFAGLVCGLPTVLFGYTFASPTTKLKLNYKLIISYTLLTVVSFGIAWIIKLDAIYILILIPMIVGMTTIFRGFKIRNSMIVGVVSMLITVIVYKLILHIYPGAIVTTFISDAVITKHHLLGVPIGEVIFAFALGFGTSGCYEDVMGLQRENKESKKTCSDEDEYESTRTPYEAWLDNLGFKAIGYSVIVMLMVVVLICIVLQLLI